MPGATFLMSPGSGTSPQGKRSWASRRWDSVIASGMSQTSGGRGRVSRPWNDCPPCDIAPAETLRPVDQIDRLVGAGTGFLHGGRQGRDVQYAPAIGEDAFAVGRGAGMEDLDALDLRRGVEAADLAALGIGLGIALGGED